jgi:hypothetical protein
VERLALGVLLFDRIVLPTPSGVAEADRWDALGWDTAAQARRIVQLDGFVHFAPWDARLRDDWRARWNQIKEIGAATRDLAYAATPMTIALTAWEDVMASVGPDYRPIVRPIPVMWASSLRPVVRGMKDSTVRDIGAKEKGPVQPSASSPYAEVSALRFRRLLEQPVRDAPEDTLDAALRLADSPDFQEARRTLYTAETLAAAGQLPPEEFGVRIDAAVLRYNQIVTAYERATVRRVVHHVVPLVVEEVLAATHVPGAASAGRWSAEHVVARLLPLPPAPQADDEGTAVAMTQRAMSAVCAGRLARRGDSAATSKSEEAGASPPVG